MSTTSHLHSLLPHIRIHGADVSVYQGDIDMHAMARNATFMFIRTTIGRAGVDARAAQNWANSVGLLLRGGYHFFVAEESPIRQARHFADVLREMASSHGAFHPWGDLPPVLDFEPQNVSYRQRWNDVKTFMSALTEEFDGEVAPIIYTAAWVTENMPELPEDVNWPLWVAHYDVGNPTLPKQWDTWLFWQYSQSGPGRSYGAASRYIDLNTYNGTLANFLLTIDVERDMFMDWWVARAQCLFNAERHIAPANEERWIVRAWALNVRAGPEARYAVVGKLYRGDHVTTDMRKGVWARMKNSHGWIHTAYLEKQT